MIEQFWYTRPAGRGGTPGFQIVAASPGLRDRHSSTVATALRLCRYDPPADPDPGAEPPPSFGWVDADGLRYCFRRVPAGVDEYGRPGNLAAHILVAPRELLPAAELAARFASPWWWRGSAVTTAELPCLSGLASVPRKDPPEPAGLLPPFLDAILGRGPRTLVAVPSAPQVVAGLVAAVERRFAGLMDEFAVSTYEGPDTALWFDIVGAVKPPPGALLVTPGGDARTAAPVARARTLILAPAPRALALASRAAGIGTPEADVRPLAAFIGGYDDLIHGARPGDDVLAALLGRPAVVDATLQEFPAVRAELALALVRGAAEPVAAAVRSGAGAPALEAVGTAIADALTGNETAAPGRWDPVLARLPGLSAVLAAACERALLDRLAGEPALVEAAGPRARLALLHRAAGDGLRPFDSAVRGLLDGLGTDWPTVADDSRFASEWRGQVLAAALGSGRAAPADVAARLVRLPELVPHAVGHLAGAGRLRAVVVAVAPDARARFVFDAARALPPAGRTELIGWYAAEQLTGDARLRFLVAGRSARLLHRADEPIGRAVRAAVAGRLARDLDAGALPRTATEAEDLLAWCADAESAAWLAVLRLDRAAPASVPELRDAVARAGHIGEPGARDVALRCAALYFVARRPAPALFGPAAAVLREDALVAACATVLRATGDEAGARSLLRHLLRRAVDGEAGEDPAVRALAQELSAEVQEKLEREARALGPEALRWWHGHVRPGLFESFRRWLGGD
ncbi:GAP1-N2 domain-containing protein [Dactylosporangium darangshiense]|uniref:GTPase-associated protein 1 N-terminal domain-containing protein n=1 Tax=Dactylosporangium darangshiense TaxID=579108 RepID=A0ABP8DJI3_9ACTN